MITSSEKYLERAKALKLYGIVSHWSEVAHQEWIPSLLDWEERARSQRSLERRLHSARLGKFKKMADFDWNWPTQCDQESIDRWMQLDFIKNATNLLLCGPNGVGKSTIARNIAQNAIFQGYTALFITAGSMMNDLSAQDGDNALRRRIKYYTQPALLIIDEIGYLSYSNRSADLLFEIVSQRYESKSIMITTNKPFSEWREIFPNAACVVSLIDRLVHHSEVVTIVADSFRLKEAKEQSASRDHMRKEKN